MSEAAVDGIRYELRELETQKFNQITAYHVYADGVLSQLAVMPANYKSKSVLVSLPNSEPRPVVVILHHGSSGDSRWTILGGGRRVSLDTQTEVYEALAKMLHG